MDPWLELVELSMKTKVTMPVLLSLGIWLLLYPSVITLALLDGVKIGV